jgi:hypothetical protein
MLAGVNTWKAIVATLAYRLASYWLPLLAGAVAYPLYRRRYGSVPTDDPGKARAVENTPRLVPGKHTT